MPIPGTRVHDYPQQAPEQLFAAIAADGWQTVQLAFKKAIPGINSSADVTGEVIESTKAVLAQNGLSVAVLGSYIEPSLTDEAARKAQVAEFCQNIAVAKALNAGCIGTETTSMEKQPAGTTRAEALQQLRKSLTEILPLAQEMDVVVAVEPVYYHAMATPEDTRDVLRDMQSKHLKVIYDPVNILSPEDAKNQHALWQRAMECFGGDIAAMHIKGIQWKDGMLVSCGLAESIVDHECVFNQIKFLNQSLPVLREEVKPAHAMADLSFIRTYI